MEFTRTRMGERSVTKASLSIIEFLGIAALFTFFVGFFAVVAHAQTNHFNIADQGAGGVVQTTSVCTSGTSPCAFVVPAKVNVIWVEAWGPGGGGSGGGGGGAPTGGATPGGGGGGASGQAGQYLYIPMRVTPGETLTITVPVGGAGGAGGAGGNNAVGNDGVDGTNASNTTIAGSLQTIVAAGGLAKDIVAGATPRGKGGTGAGAGAGGTSPTTAISGTSTSSGFSAGAVGVGSVPALSAGFGGASNANGGGGGLAGLAKVGYGYSIYTTFSGAVASGTTGGIGVSQGLIDSRFNSGVTSIASGNGGDGNGTHNGTQSTNTSAVISMGGGGGGGGGGNVAGGIAGNGADGRQGGPGYVILYYAQ